MAKILTETIIPALKSKLSDQSDKIFSATAAVAGGRITNINIAEAPLSPITYPYTIKFYIPSSISSDTVGDTYADGRITVGGVNGSQLVADPISGIGQIPGSGTPLYYNTVYTLEARNVNGAIQYTIANVHNKIKAENIDFTTLKPYDKTVVLSGTSFSLPSNVKYAHVKAALDITKQTAGATVLRCVGAQNFIVNRWSSTTASGDVGIDVYTNNNNEVSLLKATLSSTMQLLYIDLEIMRSMSDRLGVHVAVMGLSNTWKEDAWADGVASINTPLNFVFAPAASGGAGSISLLNGVMTYVID